MKQGLQQVFLAIGVTFAISGISGCVTEHTYQGTNKPVKEKEVNPIVAAQERVQLGLTYLRRGNMVQAKFNLDRALEHSADSEFVHTALAYYYQTVEDFTRAERAYENAINSLDASGDAYNNFGVFLCGQKQYQKSEEMFLKAINAEDYTRMGSSYENLGLCSQEAQETAKAIKYFDLALKYDPLRTTSMYELTRLALANKEFAKAQKMLSRYHQLVEASPQSLALEISIEQGLRAQPQS